MEGDHIKLNYWLLPFSWVYELGVRIRNMLFDIGLLKSKSFDLPVIAVGNITVGGTGKTPHVEYLVKLLQDKVRLAVLSRGYKRKTKTFLIANELSTANDIGDEPYQMKQKFPKVTVAVDKRRVHGIEEIVSADSETDAILLDDAFQHRYVKPGLNILLVDYHRLIIYDKLLPAGRMREPFTSKNRADIVIVTKCPRSMKPMDYRVITKAMDLYPYQHLFFTTLGYDPLRPVFPEAATASANFTASATQIADLPKDTHILLITGIASPIQMLTDLEEATGTRPMSLSFPDHHYFRKKDIRLINKTFADMPAPKLLVTTEKDAVRLALSEGFTQEVLQQLYVLPIRVEFMLDQQELFNENIIAYVQKYSRNGILDKGKDDVKS